MLLAFGLTNAQVSRLLEKADSHKEPPEAESLLSAMYGYMTSVQGMRVSEARKGLAEQLEQVVDPVTAREAADAILRRMLYRALMACGLVTEHIVKLQGLELDGLASAFDEFRASATSLSHLPSAQSALESRLVALGLNKTEAAASAAAVAAGVFPSVYRDADPTVRRVIRRHALAAPSPNPRELKRLVNLFRFYTLVANEKGILAGSSTPELEERLGKLVRISYLAIHWPFFLNVFATPVIDSHASSDDKEPPSMLELLERSAGTNAWLTTLEKAGMATRPRADKEPRELLAWKRPLDDLQEFLGRDPKIADLARYLL